MFKEMLKILKKDTRNSTRFKKKVQILPSHVLEIYGVAPGRMQAVSVKNPASFESFF
jgi:hypothetical protein